jgi:hypothetical protein
VPRVFKFVIKYISPTLLILMLVWWLIDQWWEVITMKGIPAENVPYVLGTRLVLLTLLVVLMALVYRAWRRREKESQDVEVT